MVWLFWIVAGGLTAAAAVLVMARAVAAARAADGAEDPALEVYRRQLSELDDLAARGLLAPEEHRAAFAESGRRLLAETERGATPETGRAPPRRLILAGVVLAVLVALGLYLGLGSPGFPDQPYRARLASWRSGDPTRLKPAEMAAVLKGLAAQRPDDPQAFEYLGRASLAADDPVAAAEAFRTAIKLNPGKADLHAMLGEAISAATEDNSTPPAALDEFRRALALDPSNMAARFFVARAQIDSGDVAGGLAAYRAIQAQFPSGDPRRALIEAEITKASGVPAGGEAIAAASGPEQAAFIKAMVGRLAARLETTPDDPDGWARLVRAYGVLGDAAAQGKALDRAKVLFAKRPADLAKVQAAAVR